MKQEDTLEQLLARLIALQPRAQRIYIGNSQAEFGDDWEPEDEVWASLEYGYDGDDRWHCGWRIREDEATVWVLRAVRRDPAEAVRAMLEDLEDGTGGEQ